MSYEPVPSEPAPVYQPAPSTPTSDKSGLAIASLVLGIINLCSWLLPICGGPLAIVGLVLGFLGLNSSKKGMAIAGLVLSGLALLLTIINAIAGAWLAANGGFDINQFLPTN